MVNEEEYEIITHLLIHLRSPREVVLEKWKTSASNRTKELIENKGVSLQSIFESWPIYKNSPELIDIDFNIIYPSSCLYTAWCGFEDDVVELLNTRLTQPKWKSQLETLCLNRAIINLDSFYTELMFLVCSTIPNSVEHTKNAPYSNCSIKDVQSRLVYSQLYLWQFVGSYR